MGPADTEISPKSLLGLTYSLLLTFHGL